jgi:hypothetical protein
MKRYLLLLVLIGGAYLLNACGGNSGGGLAQHIATHFFVSAPMAADTGSGFTFSVGALDDIGDAANGYSGTVRFTSTDGKAVLPDNTALVGGTGVFSATLETVGPQTITVTDMVTTTITGTTSSIRVATGATSLSVAAPSLAMVGKAFNFTVTAFDVLGKPVTNYLGIVTFTTTDGQAILPSNSSLTNGTGSATFSVTLQTAGNQTITATDNATSSITGTSSLIHVPAPASGFTPTSSMANARESHTATLLNDGKVLVVGGDALVPKPPSCPPPTGTCRAHLEPLASAEQFDATLGVFAETGAMATPRTHHTATLLDSGKVLVAGGDASGTAEIFDPSTGLFTPTGAMTIPRTSHTATLLCDLSSLPCKDNRVLVAGGGSFTAELFDPTSDSFTPTGSMGAERLNSTATLLKNGQVLVTGGSDASGNLLATAELFDPATGTFVPTGNMSVARTFHTATLLTSGMVLVTGGYSSNGVTATAELFDAVTGTFAPTGSMESPRTLHQATKRSDGKVLVTGGASTNNSTNNQPLATAELFDPVTGIFTHAGNMEIERVAHMATLLINGGVLITGGENSDLADHPTLASAELFP